MAETNLTTLLSFFILQKDESDRDSNFISILLLLKLLGEDNFTGDTNLITLLILLNLFGEESFPIIPFAKKV
ncbi:MAG: hypothetical protein KAX49_05120 [Halanaerobiales bacterium]|nr:hypothetical protein [Halanaerobiales bacterium]